MPDHDPATTLSPVASGHFSLAYQTILYWAHATPRAPALRDASCALDYSMLAEAIEQITGLLLERGVVAGDRVLIVAENNAAAVASLFASQMLGAWPAVVNARLPAVEMAALRALVEPRLVVFAVADSPASAEHAAREGVVITEGLLAGPIALTSASPNAAAEPEPEPTTDHEQNAVGLLIFTSGTTGQPKAVMHGHRGLLNLGRILSRSRKISAGDCYNGAAPLAHIMGVANLMSVLAVGASLNLMPRLELPQLAASIAEGQISHLSFVPTVYSRLLDYFEAESIDLSGHRLTYISCGGAPLDGTLQRRVESLFGLPLVNGYGMTECAPGTRTPADRFSEPGSIGHPEEGVEARIVDRDGVDVTDGTIGELWIRTPGAMLGYYRNPGETAATVRPGGWIATGDLARRLDNDELAIVGRRKEMIVRSGFNVYPAEVEAALNSLPEVAASGVVGRSLGNGDEEVVAFVELRPGHSLDAAGIDNALRSLIAAYKRPARTHFVAHLPLGPTGKIWKSKLTLLASELNDMPNAQALLSSPQAPEYVDPPEWLTRALSSQTSSHFITSADVRLHYRCWNAEETTKPVLLFIHGFRAHSHWWDFIAPFFKERYRVIAMDLSGMGESGSRSHYAVESFTDDIVTLLDSGIGPATLIGHSYGGLKTLRVCADRPDLVRQAIILDSRVRFLDADSGPSESGPKGNNRPYQSYEAIRQRYRVLPEQPVLLHNALEHVAFHSIQECDDGWRWRFDPALPHVLTEPDGDSLLSQIEVPVDYVYGEQSAVVQPWRAQRIAATLRHCRGAIAIPESHHHLMLDQPLVLVSVLRALLANRPA